MLKIPKAKQEIHQFQLHGNKHVDPYAWLRYREKDPDVLRYLEAENAYALEFMEKTKTFQDDLFKEMCGRIQLAYTTVPFQYKDYFYYWRTLADKEYAILCRHYKTVTADEEIILDENQLAEGKNYFHLGDYCVSPDQHYLAYTLDTEGNEEYTLHIKDLKTNELLATDIKKITPSLVWANDGETLFYIKLDETWRPYQLWSYNIVSKKSRLCYTETDTGFRLHVAMSKNEKFIFLIVASHTTSEEHILNANTPEGDFKCVYPREDNVRYDITPHDDMWYIRTNKEAKNYRLVRVPMANPDPKNWEPVIDHQKHVKIEDIEIFKDFLVVSEREEARVQLRVIALNHETLCNRYLIEFPEAAYTVHPVDNHEYESSTLRLVYTSLTTPNTYYDINLFTQKRQLLKQTPVLGGFDVTHYSSERLHVLAEDGTSIPISLVYHNKTPCDGSAPLYLYGYGSYGMSLDPWFSSSRLSLLDRGIIFAIVHVRGGGDNGEFWHDAGKLKQKINTFTDFISAADFLVQKNYTTHEKMIISGGSAGGLLIGAVLNMRPDLSGIAIADVPFVDVLNTMLDPTIPLTTAEYVEWGNPEELEYYEYINLYSPYDNVKKQHYPAILVTAGLNDPRVQYWEPAKWVAKLREYKTDNNPLLLHVNMSAGHGGASGRFGALKEVAFEYAFVFQILKNKAR